MSQPQVLPHTCVITSVPALTEYGSRESMISRSSASSKSWNNEQAAMPLLISATWLGVLAYTWSWAPDVPHVNEPYQKPARSRIRASPWETQGHIQSRGDWGGARTGVTSVTLVTSEPAVTALRRSRNVLMLGSLARRVVSGIFTHQSKGIQRPSPAIAATVSRARCLVSRAAPHVRYPSRGDEARGFDGCT